MGHVTHTGDDNLWLKNLKGKDHCTDLGTDQTVTSCAFDSFVLEQNPVASNVHNNETVPQKVANTVTSSKKLSHLNSMSESSTYHICLEKIPLLKYVKMNLINVWTMAAEQC